MTASAYLGREDLRRAGHTPSARTCFSMTSTMARRSIARSSTWLTRIPDVPVALLEHAAQLAADLIARGQRGFEVHAA